MLPSEVTSQTLEGWWKADALSLSDNDPVSSWTDSSGNARHLTQGTGSIQPTYKTNIVGGLPAVRFDGTGDVLLVPNFMSGFSAAEAFLVFKLDADLPADVAQSGLWKFGTSGDNCHVPYIDGTIYDDFGSTVRKTTANPTQSMASAFCAYNVTTKSGGWTNRLDGTQIATTGTNTVGFSTTAQFGASADGAKWLDGDVLELFLFSGELSTDDRAAMFAYAAGRIAGGGGGNRRRRVLLGG
jgi:hypothetical protein